MIANYHTHNVLCGHAECTTEEYTLEAIRKGLQIIGHSDHFPFPGDALNDGRMKYETLKEYFDGLDRQKEKYRDKITVLTGGEIEYIPDFSGYYERLLNSSEMDYLILGQHFYSHDDWTYRNVYVDFKGDKPPVMDYAVSTMRGMKTGYFAYLAHPDLFFLNDLKVDDDIMRAIYYMVSESEKNDYILELNAGGARSVRNYTDGPRYPYPVDIFWEEVAKTDIRVIIGSDAHHPNAVYDETITKLEKYAADLKLNLIEKLDL